MNTFESVTMKSSNSTSRRDVEAAIKETETRTELSVEYSVPSVNMNVQTEEMETVPKPIKEKPIIDKTQFNVVVHKLYIARRILNPVIDEIITTASTLSETELNMSINTPLCSLTKQDFRGAVRASKIFQEINDELMRKYRQPLVMGENFRFPSSRTIVNMAMMPHRAKSRMSNPTAVEVADRIYIDKELMLQLIELYEVLGETIKRLKQKEQDNASKASTTSKAGPVFASKTTSSKSITDDTSSDEMMHSALEEPEPPEPTRSTTSSKSSASTFTAPRAASTPIRKQGDKSHEKPLFDSVEQAKAQAMKCLETLANVQYYLEQQNADEIDLTNKFEIKDVPEKDTCGKRGTPHVHARLNGIPVILSSSVGTGVLNVSSSTELIVETCKQNSMTISSNGKSDRDSNTECSSVENERRTPLTSDSSPSPSSTCAEEAERSSVSTSQQYLKTDVTNDTACQAKAKDPKCMAPCIAPLPFALGRSASSTSGPSVQSISTQSSTLSGKSITLQPSPPKNIQVKPQEKVTVTQESIESAPVSAEKANDSDKSSIEFSVRLLGTDPTKKSSEIVVVNQGPNNILAKIEFGSAGSCECVSVDGEQPYQASESSIPTGKKRAHDPLMSYQLQELVAIAKPAKCCRKSYLNEPPQPSVPYPASLTSLHLDERDMAVIGENIKAERKRLGGKNAKMVYYTRLQDTSIIPEPNRMFHVMYFEVKMNKAVQNDPVDLMAHGNPQRDLPSNSRQTDFSQTRTTPNRDASQTRKSTCNGSLSSRCSLLSLNELCSSASKVDLSGSDSQFGVSKEKTNRAKQILIRSISQGSKRESMLLPTNLSSIPEHDCDRISLISAEDIVETRDIGSNCEYSYVEQKSTCTQYNTTEAADAAKSLIAIPSVLYDRDGNTYLVKLPSQPEFHETPEPKRPVTATVVKVNSTVACQSSSGNLISGAECSSVESGCSCCRRVTSKSTTSVVEEELDAEEEEEISSHRSKALGKIKKMLQAVEVLATSSQKLSTSSQNSIASCDICTVGLRQHSNHRSCLNLVADSQSADVKFTSSMFSLSSTQEVCHSYKEVVRKTEWREK